MLTFVLDAQKTEKTFDSSGFSTDGTFISASAVLRIDLLLAPWASCDIHVKGLPRGKTDATESFMSCKNSDFVCIHSYKMFSKIP